MKINYNYHTHTKRCGHAIGSDEEYVVNAIKSGYPIIGFSDHAPFINPQPGIRMPYELLPDYVESITNLKQKYKNQINILIGLECEYFPSQIDLLIEYRKKFDYLLLGQHNQEYLKKSNFSLTDKEDLLIYAETIEKACDSNLFDILVHPDIFMFSYPKWDETCDIVSNRIIDAAIKNDIPLEVNCGGVKYGQLIYEDGIRYPYPHINFFKLAKEKGAKIVLGLDVHDPQFFENTTFKDLTLELVKKLDLDILQDYDLAENAKKRKEKFNEEEVKRAII